MKFKLIDTFDKCNDDQRSKAERALQQLSMFFLKLFMIRQTHVLESRNLCEDDKLQPWLQCISIQEITVVQDDVKLFLSEKLNATKGCDEMCKENIARIINVITRGQ